jgi:hypothetical protein
LDVGCLQLCIDQTYGTTAGRKQGPDFRIGA